MLKDIDLIEYSNVNQDMIVKFHPNNGVISGSKGLIQRIIKRIFTIQGTNSYQPYIGSQFNKLFTAVTLEEAEEVKSTFSILLQAVIDQLKEEQLPFISELESNEVLEDIVLDNVSYDVIFGGFLINLTVKTAANTTFTITV
tara:strand:+ start:326 stop:751 length:426 start_codon:yes stop_codon:yes gene_type:complete